MVDAEAVRANAFRILDYLEDLGVPKTVKVRGRIPDAGGDVAEVIATIMGLTRSEVRLAVAVLRQNKMVAVKYGLENRLQGICLPKQAAIMDEVLSGRRQITPPDRAAQIRGARRRSGAPAEATPAEPPKDGEAIGADSAPAGDRPPADGDNVVVLPVGVTNPQIRDHLWLAIRILAENSTNGLGHDYAWVVLHRALEDKMGRSHVRYLFYLVRGLVTHEGIRVLRLPPEIPDEYFYQITVPVFISEEMIALARKGAHRRTPRPGNRWTSVRRQPGA